MKYKVTFACSKDEKLPAIKLIRLLTGKGLKDAKDFTEEKIMPRIGWDEKFTLQLNELQLGRYYIAGALGRLYNMSVILSVEEVLPFEGVDLSNE